MTGLDDALGARLDRLDPGESVEVVLILDAARVRAGVETGAAPHSIEGRKAFANTAVAMLAQVIDEAAEGSGMKVTEIDRFEHMASARLRAPAALVRQLARHPWVGALREIEGQEGA